MTKQEVIDVLTRIMAEIIIHEKGYRYDLNIQVDTYKIKEDKKEDIKICKN